MGEVGGGGGEGTTHFGPTIFPFCSPFLPVINARSLMRPGLNTTDSVTVHTGIYLVGRAGYMYTDLEDLCLRFPGHTQSNCTNRGGGWVVEPLTGLLHVACRI